MKKNDKRFLIVFVVIVAISLLYLFQSSYAKYRKQVTGEVNARIASWNIKVNNEDISNKSVLSNTITPVLEEDEYVKEGVLAPGTTGHFDIVINAENVDVDFSYELESETDEETPLSDIRFTKYEINGTEYTYTENGKITGDLVKNSGDTSLRIYFEWYDGTDNNMNNTQDTTYATTEANANTKIKVAIKFTQKKSA